MEVLEPATTIVGLVITLKARASESEAVVRTLAAHPELALGDTDSFWIAAAATTPDPRRLHRELEALPGVAQVDVVFVELSDAPDHSPF